MKKEPAKRATATGHEKHFRRLRYRTLRAFGFLTLVILVFRSTPGFMLPPAARVPER
jgi:hypothetical protein